jgi:hypothetical protein
MTETTPLQVARTASKNDPWQVIPTLGPNRRRDSGNGRRCSRQTSRRDAGRSVDALTGVRFPQPRPTRLGPRPSSRAGRGSSYHPMRRLTT